jgi:hypothetical protein
MTIEANLAIDQLARVRHYTTRLLDSVDEKDWYRFPAGGVTHIGWQAGHLAMAEYRLALGRIRGFRPEDENLITKSFQAQYGAGSVADSNPANQPSPPALKALLQRVHEQALKALRAFDGDWQEKVTTPHPMFETKLGSILWCAQHEMLHSGHIGLLRRLLGYAPLW